MRTLLISLVVLVSFVTVFAADYDTKSATVLQHHQVPPGLTTSQQVVQIAPGPEPGWWTVTGLTSNTLLVMPDGTIQSPAHEAGTLTWFATLSSTGVLDPQGAFDLYLEGISTTAQWQILAAGLKTVVPPPTSSAVKVIITSNTVSAGRAWLTVWIEGVTGGTNTYTLLTANTEQAKAVTTSRGPVSLSALLPVGAHTATVKVANSNGATGSATTTITVR